jgi:uncharacterized protein (TIGR03437 family)
LEYNFLMKTIPVCVLAVGVVFPALLAAQTPTVVGVFNQGSREAGLSPGVLAEVEGGPRTVFDESATVTVGGLPAAVLEYIEAVPQERKVETLRIQIPVELDPGPTTLVVSTSAGSSEPFDIMLQEFSPALLGFATPSSAFPIRFTCYPLNPATPGDTVTLAAVGLGPTDPEIPTGMAPADAVPTVTRPSVTIGGVEVEVLESVLSTDIGVYWVTFRLPTTEGSFELLLRMGGAASNRDVVAIGRAIRNISSAWRRSPAAPESIQLLQSCGSPLIEPAVPGAFSGDPSFFGDSLNPPTSLGGVTVLVTDANGVGRLAPLLFVSPVQINYLIPAGTVGGFATVTTTNSSGTVLVGRVEMQPVAPVLYGAALVVRLRDGVQTVETVLPPIAAADGIAHNAPRSDDGEILDGLPIDLGPETDQIYLVLFGTGLRHRTSPAAVSVKVGEVDVPVLYADKQSEFAGLDQVNIALPRALAGAEEAELLLTVDGVAANIMYFSFR